MSGSKAVNRAYAKLQRHIKNQISIIYPSACLALWNEFGWREHRIWKVLNRSQKIIDELSEETDKSVIEVLDDETGIEITLPGTKSYKEYMYLNSELYRRRKPMSNPQLIHMCGRMETWVAPQIIACLCLSLHREYGFGADRLSRFVSAIDTVRAEHGENKKWYAAELENVTGMKAEMMQF